MKKTICCIGSSGFIGREIYNNLKNLKTFEIFRYSSQKNEFLDPCNLKTFDYLIFSAGIHNESENDTKNIFYETKKIFRNTKNIFFNSNSIIYISSFKTCFNLNEKIIKSSNQYNYYDFDNNYGKSKIIFEKLFIRFCKNFNKKYKIVCPSHVIGPNDTGHSANGKFFNNLLKKKIIFFPDCNISLVDVRNLSQVISNVLINEDFDNSKVIVNDTSITIKDYIEQIKLNEKNYIKIKINLFYLKILFLLNQILIKIKLTKKDFISKNRIKYIEINPITELTNQKRKISFNQTILDTRNFFLKK